MKPGDCRKAARALRALVARVEATAEAETPRQRAARTQAINRLAQAARRLYERNVDSKTPNVGGNATDKAATGAATAHEATRLGGSR